MMRAALLLLFLAPPAVAQLPISLEGGIVHVSMRDEPQPGGGSQSRQGGNGFDLGLRVRYRFLSIGAGITRSRLSHAADASGEGFEDALHSIVLRPRLEILPGRRINPFVEMHVAQMSGELSSTGTMPIRLNSYGRSTGYGVGAMIRLTRLVSMTAAAEWGSWKFDDVRVDNFPLDIAEEARGELLHTRVGVALALPRPHR